MTFQVILSTDGETSFATFIYGNLLTTINIVSSGGAIGFDSGDQGRSATVFDVNQQNFPLRILDTFRIDGIY